MVEKKKTWPVGGYAPGGYSCRCRDCQTEFIGDKRATQCVECAVSGLWQLYEDTLADVARLHHEKMDGLYPDHNIVFRAKLSEARASAIEESAQICEGLAAKIKAESPDHPLANWPYIKAAAHIRAITPAPEAVEGEDSQGRV